MTYVTTAAKKKICAIIAIASCDSLQFVTMCYVLFRFSGNCCDHSDCNCFLAFFFCNDMKQLRTINFDSFFLSFFFFYAYTIKKTYLLKIVLICCDTRTK